MNRRSCVLQKVYWRMNAGLAQPIFPGSSSRTAGPPIFCSNNSGFSRQVSKTFSSDKLHFCDDSVSNEEHKFTQL